MKQNKRVDVLGKRINIALPYELAMLIQNNKEFFTGEYRVSSICQRALQARVDEVKTRIDCKNVTTA